MSKNNLNNNNIENNNKIKIKILNNNKINSTFHYPKKFKPISINSKLLSIKMKNNNSTMNKNINLNIKTENYENNPHYMNPIHNNFILTTSNSNSKNKKKIKLNSKIFLNKIKLNDFSLNSSKSLLRSLTPSNSYKYFTLNKLCSIKNIKNSNKSFVIDRNFSPLPEIKLRKNSLNSKSINNSNNNTTTTNNNNVYEKEHFNYQLQIISILKKKIYEQNLLIEEKEKEIQFLKKNKFNTDLKEIQIENEILKQEIQNLKEFFNKNNFKENKKIFIKNQFLNLQIETNFFNYLINNKKTNKIFNFNFEFISNKNEKILENGASKNKLNLFDLNELNIDNKYFQILNENKNLEKNEENFYFQIINKKKDYFLSNKEFNNILILIKSLFYNNFKKNNQINFDINNNNNLIENISNELNINEEYLIEKFLLKKNNIQNLINEIKNDKNDNFNFENNFLQNLFNLCLNFDYKKKGIINYLYFKHIYKQLCYNLNKNFDENDFVSLIKIMKDLNNEQKNSIFDLNYIILNNFIIFDVKQQNEEI